MRTTVALLLSALALGCGSEAVAPDAGAGMDAGARRDAGSTPRDAGRTTLPDAGPRSDAGAPEDEDAGGSEPDAAAATDASTDDALAADRQRLLDTLGPACATWEGFDESQRLVFLTLTHRLHSSVLEDGTTALSHLTRVYAVLGGGSDGTECGGAENNRLFLQMDDALWTVMVETWDGTSTMSDGGGSRWERTSDVAGPHDPFDASDETDSGLRCAAFLIETSDSRPPTAQAHFFLDGSAAPVERGPISLPEDPRMLEIDHDFDCLHRSNPTCRDFVDRYLTHYGPFDAEWSPGGC